MKGNHVGMQLSTIYAKITQNKEKKSRRHVVKTTMTTGQTKMYGAGFSREGCFSHLSNN